MKARSLKRFGWSGDITTWRPWRSFEEESTSPYADLFVASYSETSDTGVSE